MARNKRAPLHLLEKATSDGRYAIGAKTQRRLLSLYAQSQGAVAVFRAAQAAAQQHETQFRDALYTLAETVGIDTATDFRWNLDEGWIAPAPAKTTTEGEGTG